MLVLLKASFLAHVGMLALSSKDRYRTAPYVKCRETTSDVNCILYIFYIDKIEFIFYEEKWNTVILPGGSVISRRFHFRVENQRLVHWSSFGKQIWWFVEHRQTEVPIVLPFTTLWGRLPVIIPNYTVMEELHWGRMIQCYWFTTLHCEI